MGSGQAYIDPFFLLEIGVCACSDPIAPLTQGANAATQIVLQDDGGRYFIDQRLVLTRLLAKAAIKHGLMGQYRCEALVVVFDRHLRMGLTPSCHKLLYPSQVLAGLAVGLARLANDDTLYRFTLYVLLKPVEQF